MTTRRVGTAGVTAGMMLLAAGSAVALGSNTGVNAGFHEIATNIQAVIDGAGGFAVLLFSIAIAAIAVAFRGSIIQVGFAFFAALLLGYGVNTFASFAGISATTEFLMEGSRITAFIP
ncbi:hypothetical protein [Ruegeria sp. HKCCD8929]|uniref:hypothetical protein n=1 Tax=Ruegeria sp. HKCCD8929 TaxID=2683006 RepID=UPI001488CA32|nr:hypothetical protein [Ruegeria sp. HKCCD8929]